MSPDLILTAVLVTSCVSFISIPLSGHISDRIGRKDVLDSHLHRPQNNDLLAKMAKLDQILTAISAA